MVQYLDNPQDKIPAFEEIAGSHFLSKTLGDISLLGNTPMTFGEKPEAHADASPAISSYKANFIPGGLIFNMHLHHYSNGLAGWASFTKQLAENCYAVFNNTALPSFDPRCLDRTLFATPSDPGEQQIDAPPRPDRHPQHRLQSQSLLFHLPKSRAAALKEAANPGDNGSWISTYDAVCALMWRVFSRIRQPVYMPEPTSHLHWVEGVNMMRNFPDLPARMQGNISFDILSTKCPVQQLTVAEVISEASLSRLASYTRQMTNSATVELVADELRRFRRIRNKEDLSVRVDAFPPMSLVITDWREADVCRSDFGFGRPAAFRHLFDKVAEGLAIVYPPRNGPAGEDEGIELQVTFEKELVDELVNDAQWKTYFEFRGVDAEGA